MSRVRWELFDSGDVAAAIVAVAPALTDEEVREALRTEWTRCDGHARWRAEIIDVFRRAGYVSDSPRRLPSRITIYRGNAGEPEPSGISWTHSPETARKFARYVFSVRGAFLGLYPSDPDARPTVWEAKVDRKDVLGYFVERGESEVVVDPATVRGAKIVWTAERPPRVGG